MSNVQRPMFKAQSTRFIRSSSKRPRLRVRGDKFNSSVLGGRWALDSGRWTFPKDSTAAYLVGIPQTESDAEAAGHRLQPMVDVAKSLSTKYERQANQTRH